MSADPPDLVAFVRACLDEDERVARAASRPYRHADDGATAPPTGVHWEWVTGEDWTPVQPDPTLMEFVEGTDGSWSANLATVEKWPSSIRIDDERIYTTMMPFTYANSIEEMDPAGAAHIARHDPARMLAEVAAKRRLIEVAVGAIESAQPLTGDRIVRLLAQPYAGRPGWRGEWAT
jgi:hypothetical protein